MLNVVEFSQVELHEKGSAVCGRPKPNTGRGGAPKFFLDWLTFALKPYDADHIVSKFNENFDPVWGCYSWAGHPPSADMLS